MNPTQLSKGPAILRFFLLIGLGTVGLFVLATRAFALETSLPRADNIILGQAAALACATNNPIAWWSAEGDARDRVGNLHGTIQGGVSFTPGMAGQAFGFNGVDGAVEIGTTAIMNTIPLSIEAWVRPERRDDAVFFPNNAVSNDEP